MSMWATNTVATYPSVLPGASLLLPVTARLEILCIQLHSSQKMVKCSLRPENKNTPSSDACARPISKSSILLISDKTPNLLSRKLLAFSHWHHSERNRTSLENLKSNQDSKTRHYTEQRRVTMNPCSNKYAGAMTRYGLNDHVNYLSMWKKIHSRHTATCLFREQ